jgi:hypothetical protein
MTITNPETAGATVQRDATDAARRTLTAISLGTVAPEAYAGKLRSHDRLMGLVQGAFDRASSEALAIVGSARADIDGLRHDELRANPFASDCFGRASRSVRALPPSLDADSIKAAIAGLVDTSLEDACRDLDRNAARKLKMQRGTDRTRRRGKAEIDAYAQKLIPVLSAHIAGLVRDELAGELTRRYEAGERSQAALRRLCAEAADPGDDIPGSHRFSCGPRVEVVLKAVAARRPDLLDRDGRPTDAIWTAFGAEVAAGDLGVMEDPQQSIEALQRFLETTVAGALDGLTLDALYAVTREPPEVPSWIGRPPHACKQCRAKSPTECAWLRSPPPRATPCLTRYSITSRPPSALKRKTGCSWWSSPTPSAPMKSSRLIPGVLRTSCPPSCPASQTPGWRRP